MKSKSKKRILFVAPTREWLRVKKQGERPIGTPFLRLPPLSAPTISALTPRDAFEFLFIDEQVDYLDMDMEVDLVAIVSNTATANRSYQIADAFRARSIPTVLGGIHPTLNWKEAAKHGIVVVGWAENAWPQVLADLETGTLKDVYHGKFGGANFVVPDRSIFKGKPYLFTAVLEASRGCVHSCNFCTTAAAAKGTYVTKPVEQVVEEVRSLKSKFVIFVDDNIFANPSYARSLFKALKPLKIKWSSQSTYLLGLDETLTREASQSGCFALFMGFESISDSTLKNHDKSFGKAEGYRKAMKNFNKYGILIQGSFIFGADQDTPETFAATLRFIQENRIPGVFMGVNTPLPGTPFHARLEKENRITEMNYSDYDYKHCVFKPKNMTREQLMDGLSWMHKEYFRLDRVIVRAIRLVPMLLMRGTAIVFLAYYLMSFSRLALLRKLRQIS